MNSVTRPLPLLVKALCLFILANIVYALVNPEGTRISGYNAVFPGRTRLPFGISSDPFTVTVEHVDSMFASHLISAAKRTDEYRVALIGDSSIWGENLGAYEVISEQWNQQDVLCGEKRIRAYDLGYPHPSILKDLLILEKALEYEPDLVVWFVTLNTLFSQRLNPFLLANREQAAHVLGSYDIAFKETRKLVEVEPTFYERTLVGRRSDLARHIKLEMLGIIWTATRSDTNTLAPDDVPDFYVEEDPTYRGLQPPAEIDDLLLFSAIHAGHEMAGSIPVLIVNQPTFVVDESISRLRYNPLYPRWAYDQYREALAIQAETAGWSYLDLWNAIPAEYFSEPGLHLSPEGERQLIQQMNPAVQRIACGAKP